MTTIPTTSLSGPLPIKLTNDFFFKYLLQNDNNILNSIVRAFLPIRLDDQLEVYVTNPFEEGDYINSKTMILDIKAIVNHTNILNLEMQVFNQHDWPERSLSYLARCFDNLKKGEQYIDVKATYHIGFLNYTLFPDTPEFYSHFMLLNTKTHNVYTSKFSISVVDLTHIDLATDEDKLLMRDMWASFFRATTWEELDMLAEKNDIFNTAKPFIMKVSREEHLKQLYEAREDQLRQQRDAQKYYQAEIAKRDSELATTKSDLADANETIKKLKQQIKEMGETPVDK